VHVAFRYPDEHGCKEDAFGNRITGFLNERFDMRLKIAGPNIKPFKSMSYDYHNVATDQMKWTISYHKDIETTVENGKLINTIAVPRKGFYTNIKFIPFAIDSFGKRGGYDLILQYLIQIAEGKIGSTCSHLHLILNFLTRSLHFWTRQFTAKYTPLVAEAF